MAYEGLGVEELLAAGRLRPEEPDRVQLDDMLAAASRDVAAAHATSREFPAWGEAMLYEAGLRAARVIVMASSYRIGAERGHVTAIDAADALTGGEDHRLFVRLHRLRRRRHDFLYEVAPDPSQQELATAGADAEALISLARRVLKGEGLSWSAPQ